MTIRLFQTPMSVEDVVRESNGIEGIFRAPTSAEMEAFYDVMNAPVVTVSSLTKFVVACTGIGAPLRDKKGLNVRVGSYMAPPGGPTIKKALAELLTGAETMEPHALYLAYENLHPFVDGNGRSGRALYHRRLGPNGRSMQLGFLRDFHYRTLSAQSSR